MDAYGASSSSSACSLFTSEKYDVFLSFRGEDTRNTFTSHLYAALHQKKIKTYIDEKSLERGDQISTALPEAIKNSKISVIVFSKDYASSSWCLSELAQILECHKESKHMVIPIFYEVDPSHIRKQEGSYGEAFLKHEARFNDRMDIVQKWRAALTESANLSGWDSQVTRPESKLVEAIVEDVLRKLNRVQPSNFGLEGLVGIDEQMKEIKSMLNVCSPKVRIVGIWGMGGIGKTTLAQVIFNQLSSQFEARCFVPNVREESKKKSLIKLRNKLLAQLLNEERLNVGTPSLVPTFVKERLQRTKVLIVLDDVNCVEQLNSFLGDRDMFSSESRIIITTRDATMLRDIAGDGMYEVKQLEFNEALQLFNLIAFRGNSPDMDYMELSKNVVKHAGGIPLAIRVLGSHFRSLPSQSKQSWEMALGKLKVAPHDKIQNALRVSYDGLDDMEKDIFLDIACFFKGMSRGRVEKILDACNLFANTGIGALIDKSLISISYEERLWMHDLVQEMGQNIVRQESKECGQRSRLWIAEDAHHVLVNNEGTAKIQGIFLDLSQIDEFIHLETSVFQKMCNLRLLKIYYSSHERRGKLCLQDLKYLPHSLRYLAWHKYPLKYLPSNFKRNNLVELKMPYSQLEQLWAGVQDLNKLRRIDLSNCIYLTQIPDLSSAPNVERINLSYCTSLLQFPLHILQNLNKLIEVNLGHCNNLQSVSDRICDAAFHRTSTLQRCSNLSTLPMTTTKSLVSLDLSSTNITSLPSSINSINLSKLCLRNCTRLANLPSSMNKLGSLKELHLGGCSILETFPELPWNIRWLNIGGTAIKEVASSSIEGRFDLLHINSSDCKSLESLPTNLFKLRSLMTLNLSGCSNLKNLPEILEPMERLSYLNLSETGIKELPSSIEHLVGVEKFHVDGCKNLESIPSTICNMTRLRDLHLSNCTRLATLPSSMNKLDSLKHLNLSGCSILETFTELPRNIKTLDFYGTAIQEVVSSSIEGRFVLRQINLSDCKSLWSLPTSIFKLRSLMVLNLSGCSNLKSLPEILEPTKSLKSLYLSKTGIKELPSSIEHLVGVEEFHVEGCKNLESIPSTICNMTRLRDLHLSNCTRLATLPSSMNKLDSLKHLNLSGCSIFETFPELPWNITQLDIGGTAIKEVASSSIEGGFNLQKINFSDCRSLQSLPTNIFKLRCLMELNLSGCSNLKNLQEILEPLACENLESIPSTICNMTSLQALDLTNCPKLECSPILDCFLHWGYLSSLGLSSSNIIEIPASINGISNLTYLYIRNCKNLRSLPELPLSLRCLDASGCTSLKVVSNLKGAFTQEFWDDPVTSSFRREQFMFCDCLQLDEEQRQNILADFRLRVLRVQRQAKGLPYDNLYLIDFIGASCPGNDIPKWFEYQSEGSFIDIKLPLEWANTNFLGFVLCVVGYSHSNRRSVDLKCEINPTPNQGEEHKVIWRFDLDESPTTSDSSNVYMWHGHRVDWSEYLDAVEMSFRFYAAPFLNECDAYETSEFEVKKCGIHLLYSTEFEEVRLNGIKSFSISDAIANKTESSSGRIIDFDTGEPHPKRIKF